MKEITIQIGTGCPTGTTKEYTKYTKVTIPEELAVDFCRMIHNRARGYLHKSSTMRQIDRLRGEEE